MNEWRFTLEFWHFQGAFNGTIYDAIKTISFKKAYKHTIDFLSFRRNTIIMVIILITYKCRII